MLDMLIDQCVTMCFCVRLAIFYQKWALLFQLSIALDISSHWLHMHRFLSSTTSCFSRVNFFSSSFKKSSMVKGLDSHKTIDLSGNPILRLYYTSRVRKLFDLSAFNWAHVYLLNSRNFCSSCVLAMNYSIRCCTLYISLMAHKVSIV
jgi:CDP-diacylglycerol--inositol 3-phosphatidyltransferase